MIDIKKAIRHYKEESSFNLQYSKNNLGVIYKNGFIDKIEKQIGWAIIYFEEAIKQKNDLLSMYNLATLHIHEIPFDDSIDRSIELLIKLLSFRKNALNSYNLLCISLIKKIGFNIKEEDIQKEVKKYTKEYYELANMIFSIIAKNYLNEESVFNMFYNLYKTSNILYDEKLNWVESFTLKSKVISQEKSSRMNITNEYYK